MSFEGLLDNELAESLKTAEGKRFDQGFLEIMRRFKSPIFSYLYRYTGDLKTAEDLAQETFLRVFKKIKSYNPAGRFSTWLYTIASNLAKDELKRRTRHRALSYDWGSSGQDAATRPMGALARSTEEPEALAQRRELEDQVQSALDKLEEVDREVLVLREIQGMKYEEISGILDLPLGTVKSRIARARLAFKDVWERKPR